MRTVACTKLTCDHPALQMEYYSVHPKCHQTASGIEGIIHALIYAPVHSFIFCATIHWRLPSAHVNDVKQSDFQMSQTASRLLSIDARSISINHNM
jgi:hypothetical protein